MFNTCIRVRKKKIYLIGDIGGTNTRLSIFQDNKKSIFEKIRDVIKKSENN